MDPSRNESAAPLSSDKPADRSEFFALYTKHSRMLYRYVRVFVPHHADAEDIFQEVSAVLWEKFSHYQSGTNFAAWAISVARFSVMNLRHRQRRLPISFSDEFFEAVAQEAVSTPETMEDQHRALGDCYRKLSVADRTLIDLRYRGGSSVKDLAEKTGRPLRTVYRVLDRIHVALLNCIERKLNKEGGPS